MEDQEFIVNLDYISSMFYFVINHFLHFFIILSYLISSFCRKRYSKYDFKISSCKSRTFLILNTEFFFFKKSKNIRKVSNYGEIKPVTVRQYKTASNLLKPIAQSKIITQKLETKEKQNVFDLESVTIEQLKSVTKLSKPIKQPKIITQKPSKIKLYTESNTADCTLQLDIVKGHIFPEDVHNNIKIEL